MQRLEVSTDVFVAPARVYEFLLDFRGYARYSEYVEHVERRGDGGAGTVYEITASWWRLTHTVRTEVTALEPPERIAWRLRGRIAAAGAWLVEPRSQAAGGDASQRQTGEATTAPQGAATGQTSDAEAASRVTLVVRYDPDTVDVDAIDLPAFVSLDRVVDRVVPLVEREARRVVERVVADLEGQPREVDLRVEVVPDDGSVT